ncbi:PQQ-dependent dehydrogenase, methanol/ethanol family [Fretibacter rubidus]|uniref:PQQ-dependent dehydrogenase, methanol/ethanol family n=1 Tax=Fretibacter rubidus TaxID=570162 RepID=UPI00352B3712
MKLRHLTLISSIIALTACSNTDAPSSSDAPERAKIETVSTQHILAAEKTPQDWLTYGGTYDEQRHSRLTQITASNIGELAPAWTYDFDAARTARGVEATPIVVDGVMYVTGAWSIVYALDAKTGEELWVYDPDIAGEEAAKGCCGVVNRGVAIYESKVFIGVFDGRLEALDAKSGKRLWSTVTVDQSKPYTITGAPRVVKDKVLIGNGGAELGVRGYISAYDVDTGDLAWRFYTTPNPNKQPDGAASDAIFAQLANDSWGDNGVWQTDGGGGTVWDSIIYDQVNDSIILGVGNGSPWNAKVRDPDGNGDNLFLSSILALDADSGAYKWHFQTTPRDQWDFTATQSLILANLPIGEDRAERRVVMQAPKNGFFYVLDAETGDFISGEGFSPVITWASGLDENGRPIVNPAARKTEEMFLMIPGPLGAHNWHPMAYSPKTQLAYIPAQIVPQFLEDENDNASQNGLWNIGYNFAAGIPLEFSAEEYAAIKGSVTGALMAWDPVKQEARWTVNYPEAGNGGVLSTDSNLVFHGTPQGEFLAYDGQTGDKLWSYTVNNGVAAAPSTYSIDGEQYVAIATGWGGAWAISAGHAWGEKAIPNVGRVAVFKLGGTAKIPSAMEAFIERSPKTAAFGKPEQVALGLQRYSDNCMVCHGPLAMSSGVLPDLRWSYVSSEEEAWSDIVLNGNSKGNGMVGFREQLSDADSEAIRAYVINQAWLAVKNGEGEAP